MPEIKDGWVYFPESPDQPPATLLAFTQQAMHLSDTEIEAYDPAKDPDFRDQWLAYLQAHMNNYVSVAQIRTYYEYVEGGIAPDGTRRASGVFPIQRLDHEQLEEFITKLKSQFG